MKGLGPLLNSEAFSHFMDKGDFTGGKVNKAEKVWRSRADYVNASNGEWPPAAPSPRECPLEFRKFVNSQHWPDLGWVKS